MIYLAADHRGFQIKEGLKKHLAQKGYQIEDVGAFGYDKDDDYVDFAVTASEKIA
jgi:ribose 5-phosphate isomerase B